MSNNSFGLFHLVYVYNGFASISERECGLDPFTPLIWVSLFGGWQSFLVFLLLNLLTTIISTLWDFPTNLIGEIQNPTKWNAVFQAIMLLSELGKNLPGIKAEDRRGSPWWISGLRSRREGWSYSQGQVWEICFTSKYDFYSCFILVSLVWNANVTWVWRDI